MRPQKQFRDEKTFRQPSSLPPLSSPSAPVTCCCKLPSITLSVQYGTHRCVRNTRFPHLNYNYPSSSVDCLDEITRILRRLDTLEKENKELKGRILELEKRHSDSEQQITNKMMDTIRKEGDSYVAKLKKNLDIPPGEVVTVKQVSDMQDRQLNLIFRGIREHDGESAQARKTHDQDQVLKIANLAGIDCRAFEDALVSTRRLGKWDKERKYRPVLVRLSSQEIRQKALTCNRQLRRVNLQSQEKDDKDRTRYRIDADLTREQKENLDKMWEVAREKTNDAKNGVRYFVIGQENPVLRYQKAEPNREA